MVQGLGLFSVSHAACFAILVIGFQLGFRKADRSTGQSLDQVPGAGLENLGQISVARSSPRDANWDDAESIDANLVQNPSASVATDASLLEQQPQVHAHGGEFRETGLWFDAKIAGKASELAAIAAESAGKAWALDRAVRVSWEGVATKFGLATSAWNMVAKSFHETIDVAVVEAQRLTALATIRAKKVGKKGRKAEGSFEKAKKAGDDAAIAAVVAAETADKVKPLKSY